MRSGVLALLLAGCTDSQQPAWTFKTAAEAQLPGPVAVWGNPDTMADAAFECRAGGSIVFWLGSEAPLSGGQPTQFRVSGATALLDEQFVEDGVGASEFLIQRGSALHAAIAAGKGRLEWRLPDGQQGAIRLAPPVQQLFDACAPV